MSAEHILVLDDEPGITRLCERLLVRVGFKVTAFVKPLDALEFLRKMDIDLLLVDIRMPEMGGFEFIAEAMALQPNAAILIMTGFGTVETAIQALRQGVDGLILKPFEKGEELIQAVRQALADKQEKRDVARSQALRPLFDITESLLTETRFDRLVPLVLRAVMGHLHCENAAFYQMLPGEDTLKLIASNGIVLSEETWRDPKSILAQVDQEGRAIIVSATGSSEDGFQEEIDRLGTSSAMCAPVSRQNVRGVLYAARQIGEPGFREVDWEMFLLLVRQAAIAMENAKLYAEVRDSLRQLEESQQALIHVEKMAAVGRMTASIAHEINNPLQAVQNCLHLASRNELDVHKRQEYLEMTKMELDRLMQTVQRMLELFRPSGLDPVQLDVGHLLRRVVELMSPQLEVRKIRVTLGISSKLPTIMAVGSQLQQVFINLILNAYDVMPDGGEIRVTARLAKNMVEMLFQDTGPGISPEYRNRIFEPFMSTKDKGIGLGLSVSYGIVIAHGGSLDLLPDRGTGACFRVLLPVGKDEKIT